MERFADNPVVTSTSSSKPKFLSGSHAILDGVEKCAAFRLVADRKRAIEWTISEARPEDTIVVITSERQNTAPPTACRFEPNHKMDRKRPSRAHGGTTDLKSGRLRRPSKSTQ